MKLAGLADIKQELKTKPAKELLDICLRLARSKRDNKELLGYLLFDSQDTDHYISQMKALIDDTVPHTHRHNLYLAKMQLRRLIGILNKRLKFMSDKAAEAEIWLYFMAALRQHHIPYQKSTALQNLYKAQQKKVETALITLHEDLQHDYQRQLSALKY